MKLYAVRTGLVRAGDNLVDAVLTALERQNLSLEDNDVLVLASKVVAYAQGRIVRLNDVKPSKEAVELAEKFSLQKELAELILRETEKIYGGVEKALLTLKNHVLTVNAGIDNKNAPIGHVTLWPQNLKEAVRQLREEIVYKTGRRVAVVIVDSGLIPLRRGTMGIALAVAGFNPIKDCRGLKDLYGKEIVITQHAVAEDLACAAHLLMGESIEETPVVLVKEAPLEFDDGVYGPEDLALPQSECVFMKAFKADN
ncbi:MAG: coenzyme F420-0:L-glutamate ligase [Candidatus Bathyarchaeia archaeon]|nr:coenzyme F420-0:L-glutamate ligase [Candidatus Bathyarchaeota archaeon]